MANRKKVLFLITKSNPGGAQRYVKDLAKRLPKEGFEVVVVAGHGSQPGSGWLHQEMNSLGIRTVTPPWFERDIQNPLKELRLFFSLWSLIKKECPDILHVNSSKAGGLGAFIGRAQGIERIIFTAHGWTSNEKRPFVARAIIRFFEWLTIILSHATIMNSEATLRHVAGLPFVAQKSNVIRLGIQAFETLSRENARHELGIPESEIMIGTIAELHRNKGIDVLIDMYERVLSVKGVIIGDGDEKEKIKKRMEEKGLPGRVRLLGAIPDAKKYMKAFDVFVLSSRVESLGYVLLEAGLARVPVAATRVGGIPEIIVHEHTGLLSASEDSEALAGNVMRLIKDEGLRKQCVDNLHKKVSEEFAFEDTLQKTLAVYRG